MSSNTANGTSAAKKKWFFKWFADKNSSETVAAALPSQSSAIKKVSLQQLFDEGMIPDELKSLTLREVVENGRLEAVGEGSITLMYNAAPKSCFGEAVACFRNAIHGLNGCQKLWMRTMVLLTMVTFVVSAVMGSALSNCNKGKNFDNSD